MTGADKWYSTSQLVQLAAVWVRKRLTPAPETAMFVAIFTQADLQNSLPKFFFALLHNLLSFTYVYCTVIRIVGNTNAFLLR